jgi:hypothetical protein
MHHDLFVEFQTQTEQLGFWEIVPDFRETDAYPLAEERVRVLDVEEQSREDFALDAGFLAGFETVAEY